MIQRLILAEAWSRDIFLLNPAELFLIIEGIESSSGYFAKNFSEINNYLVSVWKSIFFQRCAYAYIDIINIL